MEVKNELFVRNNNLRDGWFSLGNQLGEDILQWNNTILCNNWKSILIGNKAYKSRIKGNFDLYENCFIIYQRYRKWFWIKK